VWRLLLLLGAEERWGEARRGGGSISGRGGEVEGVGVGLGGGAEVDSLLPKKDDRMQYRAVTVQGSSPPYITSTKSHVMKGTVPYRAAAQQILSRPRAST
jgi:hypothetical protein